MTCSALGCKREAQEASSFCTEHWKQITPQEKRAIDSRNVLRQVIQRLAVIDGYLAPDPLAKKAVITEIEKIKGSRPVDDV